MRLFFKNGIKQLLKSKLQFTIYVVLVALAVLFASSFGIAAVSLKKSDNLLRSPAADYQYSYRFTASNYNANNTATISPWFAFDNELLSVENTPDDSNDSTLTYTSYFPVLSIQTEANPNGVLKQVAFQDSWQDNKNANYASFLYLNSNSSTSIDKRFRINFQFGDVEATTWERSFNPEEEGIPRTYAPAYDAAAGIDEYVNDVSFERQYTEYVAPATFGAFYCFNTNSSYFKTSLFGKIYQKYHFQTTKFSDATEEAKKVASDIFWYMFYLNNSTLTDTIKMQIIDRVASLRATGLDYKEMANKINDWINKSDKTAVSNKPIDVQASGFQGQVGWINAKNKYSLYDDYNKNNLNSKTDNGDDFLLANGSYQEKNYSFENMFETSSAETQYSFKNNTLTRSVLFYAYNNLVGDLANFKVTSQNQVVMWGIGGEKYRFVAAFHQIHDASGRETYAFNDSDFYKIYQSRTDTTTGELLVGHTFMASSGYAASHHLRFGQNYSIIPGRSDYELRYDAMGGDSFNSYPTIYDEDLLTDNKLQGIFYLNNEDFGQLFSLHGNKNDESIINDQKYQDVSRSYLHYTGAKTSDLDLDMKTYRLYLANNLAKINDTLSTIQNYDELVKQYHNANIPDATSTQNNPLNIDNSASKIQSYNDTTVLNLRTGLLGKTADMFTSIAVIFCVIFIAIISFVVYNIVKRLLNLQRPQIGNLKSLGVRKTLLIFNFVSYMITPVLIIVPIFWALSFVCQKAIMNIFYRYFNIPIGLDINWHFLLVEIAVAFLAIGLLVFLTAWLTIRRNPLELLHGEANEKPNILIAKIDAKIKHKHFTNKLRTSIMMTSFKSVLTYFAVFLISAMVVTCSMYVPDTLNKMSEKYYENIHYNNAYQYNFTYNNMPLSQYNIYRLNEKTREQDSLNASLFNVYTATKDGNNYVLLLDEKALAQLSPAEKQVLPQHFEDILYNNLLAIKGNSFTVGVLDKLVSVAANIDAATKNTTIADTITKQLNQLSCSFIPTIFGQKPIESNPGYSVCIQQVANNLIPSTVKAMWDENEDAFKKFSLDFSNIGFDSTKDQMLTQAEVMTQGETLQMLGLDPASKNSEITLNNKTGFLDYSQAILDSKIIPITINRKAQLKGLSIGDTVAAKIHDNALYIGSDDNDVTNDTKIAQSWWKYVNDDKTVSNIYGPNGVDLSHVTYFEPDGNTNSAAIVRQPFMWQDAEGNFKSYAKMQNIELEIPITVYKANKAAFDALKERYITMKKGDNADADVDTSGVWQEHGDALIIHPFDIRTWTNGIPTSLGIADLAGTTVQSNLWSFALNAGLVHENTAPYDTGYKLKVVGYQDTYNEQTAFINQVYLNTILGYALPSKTITIDGQKINVYANAKMSSNKTIVDQMEHIIFQPRYGDIAMADFSKNLAQAVGSATYIDVSKGMVNSLVSSVLSLGIIFIIISLVTAIVVIYLITDISVGKFKNFMSFMRVQGYTMREINAIFMWIFAPCTLVATAIGGAVVFVLLKFLLPSVLVSVEIAVPLQMTIWFIPLIIVLGIIIYLIAYGYVLLSMKKINLATLTGQM